MSKRSIAIRGPVLTYTGDPFKSGLDHTMVYESDAIVAMANGVITHFGPADRVRPQLPRTRRSRTTARIP
jgi:guanine deaminase